MEQRRGRVAQNGVHRNLNPEFPDACLASMLCFTKELPPKEVTKKLIPIEEFHLLTAKH